METLRKGMTSDKVKELQQMLRDAGFFTHPTNTGYFGDITETALKKYQQSKGMEANGVYSPTTNPNLARESEAKQFLTSIQGTPQYLTMSKLYETADPRFYSALDSLKNPINVGQYAGGGVVITPEQLQQYSDMAKSVSDPYYNDRAKYDSANYNNDFNSTLGDYNTAQQQLQAQAEADRVALNEQEGSKGTWSSNARDQRMNSLQNKYNNKFQSNYNQAYSNLNKINLGQEYNYGTGSVNMSPITQYTSQLSQTSPATFSGTQQSYNPFGSLGGFMNKQKEASANSMAENIKSSQYYNPFKNL